MATNWVATSGSSVNARLMRTGPQVHVVGDAQYERIRRSYGSDCMQLIMRIHKIPCFPVSYITPTG